MVFTAGAQADLLRLSDRRRCRELGAAIEQIHPNPFRNAPKHRFGPKWSLANPEPSLARRAPRRSHSVSRALPGARNGHTGLFPVDAHTPGAPLVPTPLYDFADGLYVVDGPGASPWAVPRRVEGRAKASRSSQPLVPRDNESSRGVAPHFTLTAEVLEGLDSGRRRPGDLTLDRPDGERSPDHSPPSTPQYFAREFANPLYGDYQSILPHAAEPLYLGRRAIPLGVAASRVGRGLYGPQLVRSRLREASPMQLVRLAREPSTARRGRTSERR